MLEELKEKLKVELYKDLPGEMAHNLMMPTARDDKFVLPTYTISAVKSAVLILFYRDDSGSIKFPLIQRPAYNGAHSAQVGFPGGKLEETDKDLVHTALREAEEEIGIDGSHVDVVGNLTDLFISVSNFIVTPVIGFMDKKPLFKPDPVEVETIIEADLFDIISPLKRSEGTILARGNYKIQTPYFTIDDRIVWGATAMMLSELSVIIGKTGIYNNMNYG